MPRERTLVENGFAMSAYLLLGIVYGPNGTGISRARWGTVRLNLVAELFERILAAGEERAPHFERLT